MNNESFYGNPGSSSSKYTRRFVTLGEAQEEAESRNVHNVVAWPTSIHGPICYIFQFFFVGSKILWAQCLLFKTRV